eukprot:701552-Pyramimonas_sp.AAC.1
MSRGVLFSASQTTIAAINSGNLHVHRQHTGYRASVSAMQRPRVRSFAPVHQRGARLQIVSKLESPRRMDPDRDLLQTLFTQSTARYTKVIDELVKEIPAYIPRPNPNASSIEELFMSTPDLETIPYKVLSKGQGYEIRQVEAYTVAEVTMDGKPFDFQASGKAFNVLADYLFGGNVQSEAMAMTTPVVQIPQSTSSARLVSAMNLGPNHYRSVKPKE